MTVSEALLLGILIGAVLGLVWSDVTSIVRIAHKTKHGTPIRETLVRDVRGSFQDAVPRWLLLIVLVSSLSLVVVGAAQVWQYNKFSNYQSCVEDRGQIQSEAQDLRTKDLIKKERQIKRWLNSIAPIFGENSTNKQFNTFKQRTIAAAAAEQNYLRTVRQNPYPKPVQEECGSVSGGE